MGNRSDAEWDAGSTRSARAGWSLRVGRPFGIPVRIHVTFPVILVWAALHVARHGGNVGAVLAFVLALFGCVVLHELGHAGMARLFGVRTREIVLFPIGGVARQDRIPTGFPELLIALAGPAVHVLIVPLLFGALVVSGVPLRLDPAAEGFSWADAGWLLLSSNIVLFFFNLIPAFPMDGGRVLRALLSLLMPIDGATRIAAFVGQTIAIAMGVYGAVSGQWLLIVVAMLVFLGAAQEAAFYRGRAAVVGRRAREAMMTEFETLAPQDSLTLAAGRVLATHQRDFPVVDAWQRVVGILTRGALLRGLEHGADATAVLEVMERRFVTVPPDVDLSEVLRLLQGNAGRPVLVLDGERLRGMISLEKLAEFIEISRRVHPASPS